MRAKEVFPVFADPNPDHSAPLGERVIATSERYPALEFRAADDDHAVAGLLRLIADAVESGCL